MERVIFKYSDFIQDDGAFKDALKEVEDFGDKIVASAKKTQAEFKKALSLDNVEAISNYEKEAEKLSDSYKKQQKAKESLIKIEEELTKQKNKDTQATEDKLSRLVKLDKELLKHRSVLADVNKLIKNNTETDRDLNKERVQSQIEIKKISKEIREQQKEITSQNELSKEEQKLAKAMAVLRKEEIEDRGDIKERIAALNVVIDATNITTEEGRKIVADYIDEQNNLRKALGDVSDDFTKNKINIGNYEESIVNALKSVNLFTGELSFLNSIVEKGIDFAIGGNKDEEKTKETKSDTRAVRKNTKEVEKNTEAIIENKKAKGEYVEETNKSTKASKRFGKALRGLGVLAVVTLFGSLASVFGQGRSGAIATARALAVLQTSLKALVDIGKEVGLGLISIFKSFGASFSTFSNTISLFALNVEKRFLEITNVLGRNTEAIGNVRKEIVALEKEIAEGEETNYAEGWNRITEAIGGARQKIDDARKAVNTLDEAAIRAFQIADDIKDAELALIGLRKEVQLLEIRSEDSTTSLLNQLEATDELLQKRVELLQNEADVAKLNLELANAKARADAERAGFNLSKDEVKFAEELLALNIRLSEENNENNLNDEFLNESIEALKTYKETLNEIEVAEKETAKTRREIQRDLFEQNLDLLIDLIDTEKNISEQFVNDTTKNFQDRIQEFNDFLIKFRQNTQLQLEEFNKQAESLGLDLDFQIQYDEDGNFEVFIGDTKLAMDNIVLLNKQLQNTGLGEIEINRFREFLIETRNGVKDFTDLSKEIRQVGIEVRKLQQDVFISDDELKALRDLDERLFQLRRRAAGTISTKDRKKVLDDITKLEKEKADILEFADDLRIRNQISAIDAELKNVEDGSERYFELLEERNDLEKELLDKSTEEQIENEKEKSKRILAERKKLAEETRSIISAVLDAAIDAQDKTIEKAEEASEKQQEAVDAQNQRAMLGLENTLAFEQRELGKRESERLKEEQKRERLEKIKALYSSYSNYAGQGEGDNAIVKALRDFAILESIQATFGDGGIVEDKIGKVPTNGKGIIRGRSHQGRNGGIPVLVERNEGFFSSKEMQNLGKNNFYKMKEIAGLGKVDSNFFSGQRKDFISSTPVVVQDNSLLVSELKSVKKAIENKPETVIEIERFADATFDILKTVKKGNTLKKSRFKITKKRL